MPGMYGTGELFADFFTALPRDFEAIVVRYPRDRKLSYAELEGVLQKVLPVNADYILVAESFSTPLGIAYAAKRPAGLRAVVLCAGFASSPVRGWRRHLYRLLSPVLFLFAMPESVVRSLLTGADADAMLVEKVSASVSAQKPEVMAARYRAVLDCDVRAELKEIAVPMLYLRPTEDRIVSAESLEEIQRLHPQIEVVAMKGPHLLLQCEPEKSAGCVADFVRKILG
jgi:pimeloyl-[acyl-carrier protein] methyl ester esterase